MTICCALRLDATTSPLLPQVTPAWLTRCAQAVTTQLVRDVAPLYGGSMAVRVMRSSVDALPGEMIFAIVDSLPDDPQAIAYHSNTGQDTPFAFLALSTCSTLDDVSTAISHECAETLGDVGVNLWAHDLLGDEWARELCDAVEANGYGVATGDGLAPIMVSDFVLPGFWATGDPGPYTYCQLTGLPGAFPSAPFATASGGYQVTRKATGTETQVLGSVRAHRAAKVAHWSSRPFRRGARHGGDR